MEQVKLITTQTSSNGAQQIVVELPRPIPYNWDRETEKFTEETKYIIVSAIPSPYSGPETYAFPADKEGNVLNYGELDGSMRGTLSHEEVLRNMGYELDRE